MQDAMDKTVTIGIDRRKPTAAITTWAVGAAVVVAALSVTLRADVSGEPVRCEADRAETVVRLLPTAVIVGDVIVLADVAEVTGPGASTAEGWAIAPAPPAGTRRSIDRRVLQQALTEQGVNLADWRFHGASRCEVARPAGAAGGDAFQDAPSTGHGSTDSRTIRAARPEPVDPNSLEGHLRAYLTARLAGLEGEPIFEFNAAVREALSLTAPTYRFEISCRHDRKLGQVPLDVTVLERDRVHTTLQMLVHVALRRQIVVAARPINRQQIIEADDLVMTERIWDRIETAELSDPARLIGQRARRFLPSQEPIALRDVEDVPLIRRNDLVTVWSRQDGFVIKTVGKAMGEASHGQTVHLKNEMSGQTFTARATGPRKATLVTPLTVARHDTSREGEQ